MDSSLDQEPPKVTHPRGAATEPHEVGKCCDLPAKTTHAVEGGCGQHVLGVGTTSEGGGWGR